MKERLKIERLKLKIFKYILLCSIDDFYIKENFFVMRKEHFGSRNYYNIEQNSSSYLSFLLSMFLYPNAITYFFVELFNFYQDLPIMDDYPYRSYSQGLTTYCLKELARNQMIRLISCQNGGQANLQSFMEMVGNYDYKEEVQMHYCYFYKQRSLDREDIPLIKSMAYFLNIDISNLKIVVKDSKIYLKAKNKFICHQLLSGERLKNLNSQTKILNAIDNKESILK